MNPPSLVRPVLRAHFRAEVVEDDEVVYLLSEKNYSYLKGSLYCLLVPFLDGSCTTAEIVDRLSLLYPEERVAEVLVSLQAKGYIEESDSRGNPETSVFWNFQGMEARGARETLAAGGVSVEGAGGFDIGPVVAALEADGVSPGRKGKVTLLLTDNYLRPEIGDFNAESLSLGRSWLLAKPVGGVLWLGPLFIPGKTGCWECLAYRLRDNRDLETLLCRQLHREEPFPLSKSMIPSVNAAFRNIVVTQLLIAAAAVERSPLASRVLTFDACTLETETHVLTKRPQCPRCGDPESLRKGPIRLQSRIKKFTSDGGHRVRSPAETLELYKDQVSPITGTVGEIKKAFRDPSGLVDIYAGIHKVRVAPNFEGILAAFQNNSTGKGRGSVQSKASAFGEAVERYSALYRDVVPDARRAVSKMTEPFVSLNDCMLFSERQYRERESWNGARVSLEQVPVPLEPDREIDWTRVWSLSEERFKYAPTAYCYLGYYDPADAGEPYFNVESNGLAAGNVLEEAILQAFFEVIERDAVSVWWYNRLSRPPVDLDGFKDPYFDALREYYASLGRDLWVLDVTNDAGIPVFAAVSAKRNSAEQEILLGAGAHFEASLAVSRALTEMNQGLYYVSRGRSGRNVTGARNDLIGEWLRRETLQGNGYLVPEPALPATTAGTYSAAFRKDLRDDIETCLKITERMGLEFLVHDLTLPDVGLNVVKVIVPGLRQLRPRYAPGRLYDVPVRMGWLDRPLEEAQMNQKGWLL